MAGFNRKKLQVFVSSTYDDLIKERQAAVEAILTAGHIPAGMELFTAGDESQMEVINQWIDESDVYLLILGGRYGSIEPKTGKSYTQLEYEYAISKGIPFFACVIKDAAIESRVKAEGRRMMETEHPQKLKEFRQTVLSRMSKFWDDTKDIKIAITETLSQLARRENLIGWIRSNTQSDLPAIADEITRLSKENAQLRAQITNAGREDSLNGLAFSEMKAVLEKLKLLSFLIENRRRLATGFHLMKHGGKAEVQQLLIRGLVEQTGTYELRLSESGRVFLNRLEALELSSESQSPVVEKLST